MDKSANPYPPRNRSTVGLNGGGGSKNSFGTVRTEGKAVAGRLLLSERAIWEDGRTGVGEITGSRENIARRHPP
jgi:hypothetical protein